MAGPSGDRLIEILCLVHQCCENFIDITSRRKKPENKTGIITNRNEKNIANESEAKLRTNEFEEKLHAKYVMKLTSIKGY